MAATKKESFYKKYYPMVVKATEGTGLFPEMVIAQMALESSWGESGLATKANNMFGVKSHGEKDGIILQNKKEGKDVSWKKYETPLDSINGYVKFLQDNTRYKKGGVLDAKTPKEQANLLQKAGYAGDSTTYANKIISTMENKENANYVKSLSTEKAEEVHKLNNGDTWYGKLDDNFLPTGAGKLVSKEFGTKTYDKGIVILPENKKKLTSTEKHAESYQNIQDEFPDGEYGRGGDVYLLPDGRIFSYDGKMGTYDKETKKANWTHSSYTASKDWKGTPGYKERQAKKDKIAAEKDKIAAEDAERTAQEQADIDKYGKEGTLITEGPHRGGTRFSDRHYRDIYGDIVYEGKTNLPKEKTTSSGGGVNIQDLTEPESKTTTGTIKDGDSRQDIERRIQDNKDILNNLGNRPKFVHDYAPDEQKNTNLAGNIIDAGRGVIGMTGANTEVPVYQRGSMFQTSMDELTQRRNMGLTDTEKDFARNMAERGYGYDVKNIAKFAGGSAGVALGGLGRATGQLYDEYGKLAVRDEAVRRQNRADFNRGALSDEQVNRQIFTDELRQVEMTKQAGAALVQDATKNIRERAQYEKAYGKGSQIYEYMKSIDRDKKESIFNQNEADARRVEDIGKTAQRAIDDDSQLLQEKYGTINKETVLGGEPTATEGFKTVDELQQMKKEGIIEEDVYQEKLQQQPDDTEMPDDYVYPSAAFDPNSEKIETVRNVSNAPRANDYNEGLIGVDAQRPKSAFVDKVETEATETPDLATPGIVADAITEEVVAEEEQAKPDVKVNDEWDKKYDEATEKEREKMLDELPIEFDASSFSDETDPEDNIKDYISELEKNPETLKKYKENPIAFLEDDIRGWESEPDSKKKTESLKNLKRNLKYLKAKKKGR